MNLLQEIFLHELEEHFRIHRLVADDVGPGVYVHHVDGTLHFVGVRFTDRSDRFTWIARFNRRYQECYELADPKSVE